MLLSELARSGFAPVDLGCVSDEEEAIVAAIYDGTARCDAVLTSGGVSVGALDLVKAALARLGELRWIQVAMKPAKPFALGVVGGVPVFGLPGNPVSSAISFELLARPALRRMAGHRVLERPRLAARATEDLPRRPDGKVHFMRVVASVGSDGGLEARSAGSQGSHQLAALCAANALAVLPDGVGIAAGGTVEVLLLDELLG
jgi:molybdenum cofactor synthesis domain-containing protein